MTDSTALMTQWTIYDSPADFPGRFVVRQWEVHRWGMVASSNVRAFDTLQQARESLPEGLIVIPRSPEDVPSIVETWM
jgi:hypothetical protein